jgi:hypothetical protein
MITLRDTCAMAIRIGDRVTKRSSSVRIAANDDGFPEELAHFDGSGVGTSKPPCKRAILRHLVKLTPVRQVEVNSLHDFGACVFVGEQQALGLLQDYSLTYHERFEGFVVRKFDGQRVKIVSGKVWPL